MDTQGAKERHMRGPPPPGNGQERWPGPMRRMRRALRWLGSKCRRSAFPRAAVPSGGSVRSSAQTPSLVPVRCRSPSLPARAAQGSARSSPSATTPAPATDRSDSAGVFPFLRSLARPTRACRSTSTRRTRTSSCSPAPRTWCPSTGRTLTEPGSPVIQASSGTRKGSGCVIHPAAWSFTRTNRRLPRPPLPASHRGAVRAHRALEQDRRAGRRPLALDLQGQHPHPLRVRCELAHRRSFGCKSHLQLADLRNA